MIENRYSMAPTRSVSRATNFFSGLHGAAGIAFLSTAWLGASVAVCALSGGGACIGSLVMTAILSTAASIGFGLEVTGATAISAKCVVLLGLTLTISILLVWYFWETTIMSTKFCPNLFNIKCY